MTKIRFWWDAHGSEQEVYLLALLILNLISSTYFYIVPLVFLLFKWVFLPSKEPTRFWSLSAIFIFCFVFILGKKKSSLCSGIKQDLHFDTTPLGSLSTFWNYRNRLIWDTNQFYLLYPRGKRKCSLMPMVVTLWEQKVPLKTDAFGRPQTGAHHSLLGISPQQGNSLFGFLG